MDKSNFGDRMKEYEGVEAKRKFLPMLPIIARIDGRTFSKFTKPFNRPFDNRMANAMRETTRKLVEDSHATIGYTQSDEITLVFYAPDYRSQIFFGGRIQKLTSVLAGMTTAFFIRALDHELVNSAHCVVTREGAELAERMSHATPHFDCRVWQVPNKIEAANTLLWRAQDARKNGISSVCRSLNSAKSMHGKGQADMVQMIADKGVDYYTAFSEADRLGSFFRHEQYQTLLPDDIWEKMSGIHQDEYGRTVTRSRVEQLDAGYFGDIEDRVEFVFGNT